MGSPDDWNPKRRRRRPAEEQPPPPPSEPFCNWPMVGIGAAILAVGIYFAKMGSFNSLILGVGFAVLLCGLMMSGSD